MGYSPPGSSVREFSKQEYGSGLPFPYPGYLPDPGIKPESPELAGRFFASEPPEKKHLFGQQMFLAYLRSTRQLF